MLGIFVLAQTIIYRPSFTKNHKFSIFCINQQAGIHLSFSLFINQVWLLAGQQIRNKKNPSLLTVSKIKHSKTSARIERASSCYSKALHLFIHLYGLLDRGVLPIQPVPRPHATIQPRVYLGR